MEQLVENIEKDMKELFRMLEKKFPVENIRAILWSGRNIEFTVWSGEDYLRNKDGYSYLTADEILLIVKQRQILFRDFSGGV